jgi:hypothetical protein
MRHAIRPIRSERGDAARSKPFFATPQSVTPRGHQQGCGPGRMLLAVTLWATTVLVSGAANAQTSSNISPSCTFAYSDNEAADILTLQRVRSRIVSASRNPRQKSECGRNAANAIHDFRACVDCQWELTGLLKDAAKVQRDAADHFRGTADSRREFLAREIEIRRILNDYLSSELANPDPDYAERRLNLTALADAYHHNRQGRELHQVAAAQSGVLGPRFFEIWALAVRSCDAWDFESGRNRMSHRALSEALCSESCVDEYAKLYSAIGDTGNPVIERNVAPYVPNHLCSRTSQP